MLILRRLKKLGIELVEGKFHVPCPKCSIKMEFDSQYYAQQVVRKKKVCINCKSSKKYKIIFTDSKWNRTCPGCKRTIEHVNKSSCATSARKKLICNSCKSTIHNSPLPEGVWFNASEGKWGTYYRSCKVCKKKIKSQSRGSCLRAHASTGMCGKCARHISHPVSQKTKEKIAARAKTRWLDPIFKVRVRESQSKSAYERWATPGEREKMSEIHLNRRGEMG